MSDSTNREDEAFAPVNAWLADRQRIAYENALVTPDGLRMIGLQRLDQALWLIGKAFNLDNSVDCPYTFCDDIRERAAELSVELFRLWKVNSKSMRISSATLAAASPEFQRIMKKVVSVSAPQKKSGRTK